MKANMNLLIIYGQFIVVRSLPLLIHLVITPTYEVCAIVVSIYIGKGTEGKRG